MTAAYSKSAAWHAERMTGIGGSDANVILSGDAEKLHTLYLEKIGAREPEDLSWVLPVQIGSVTEGLNAAFFTQSTGHQVVERNSSRRRADRPYMRCELDGRTVTEKGEDAIWEAKHVNAFSSVEDVVQKYMAQLHHNMHCAGLSHAVLSIFIGTQKHEIFEVEMDDFYLAALLDAEEDFWRCVESRTPPEGFKVPASPVAFETLREVNFTGNNAFAAGASDWLANHKAVKTFQKAEKDLKALVEPDVGRAFGHGIQVKRNKAGALSISVER